MKSSTKVNGMFEYLHGEPIREYLNLESRRCFLKRSAIGLGTAAAASLAPQPSQATSMPNPASALGLPGVPHFSPRAKRIIYLFMSGAPSQMDLFDYKPKMREKFKADLRTERTANGELVLQNRVTTMTSGQASFPIAPSIYNFEQCGQNGAWVSELLPHTKTIVDDIALVRSVWTEAINHDPAITYIQTGNQIPGRASLGAWLSYGLGNENSNLPAFVVMTPSWTGRKTDQALFNRLWGSGFLPSKHSGVFLRKAGDPVLYLSNPGGIEPPVRRRMLDAVKAMNEQVYNEIGDPETNARIAQYEMAFRMQTSVPELADLSSEPKSVKDLYGPDVYKPGTFASSCLLARRMAERGVRCVQIYHRGWDQHSNLATDLPNQCRDVDQACSGLIKDLKQRGLLEDTLIIWAGEFGRTLYSQGNLDEQGYGRDHHPKCFTVWLAGGGIKPGVVYGETDDYSVNITKNPVHIRDLNATILHQLGIDHERLTFKSQGLDQRLTGVDKANVVKDILA
jgi:hypothetical protein